MSAPQRVYIIGFMGCGKSTAGKKLASYLGWKFIDLDKEIEIRARKKIAEIFEASGESHFREIEKDVLRSLATEADTVISCGGGTPCYNNNMKFMLGMGSVIYLKMTPGQLKSRLKRRSGSRPLIKNLQRDDLISFIIEKLSEREKFYNMATLVVDGMDLNVSVIANKIKTIPNVGNLI